MMKKIQIIAVVIAVLAVVGVVAVAMLSRPLSTSYASFSTRPDSSIAASDQAVTTNPPKLIGSEFLGLPVNEAVEKAKNFGLLVSIQQGNPAVSENAINTVYMVTPTEELSAGSKVLLTFFGPMQELNPPGSPPKVEGSTVGSYVDVHLIWQPQVCPTGLPLSGYKIELSGAAEVDQNVFPAGVTGAVIRTGKSGESFIAKYKYICGGQESLWSPALSTIIE